MYFLCEELLSQYNYGVQKDYIVQISKYQELLEINGLFKI